MSNKSLERILHSMKKMKLEDVAAAAGVSPTTVSRVLNSRGYISKKTREKVENAVSEVGYIPNEVARSLSASKTNMVGLIFPNTFVPFYGEMVTRLENLLSQKGYKVLLSNTDDDPDKEKEHLKMLLSSQVDGLIVGSRNSPSEIYSKTNLAAVSIDRYVSAQTPNIRSDNYKGAVLAADYLIRSGCKQIGLFVGSPPEEIKRGDLRMKGFLEEMSKRGKKVMICPVGFDKSEDVQGELIDKHLSEHKGIDGIFATGDTLAAKIYSASIKSNRGITVVGYDGTRMFVDMCPGISTIAQPIDLMAKTAVDVLTKMIVGKRRGIKSEYVFPVRLIERVI